MPSSPIGVGVIGAGYWGTKLVREYLSAERNKGTVKLVRICDSSLATLLSHREEFSIFDDLLTQKAHDLFRNPNISAVHIATPNRTHYDLAKMALEAGKDVLLEKPMTLRSSEAYELVDLAASLGRVLHVGHIFRYNNAVREATRMLKSGAIGKTYYAKVQWTDWAIFPDRDIIFDLGPHPIDVLNMLFGTWPTRASGFARSYRNSNEHPEVAYGILEFGEDTFAHVELSWLQPGKVREVSVMGSEGKLVVDCVEQHISKTHSTTHSTEKIPVSPNNTIEAEIEHFIKCVADRSISNESSLIGAHAVEVLEKISVSMWEQPLPIVLPLEHDVTAATTKGLETVASPEDLEETNQ
jgi:UDP-N-acetylglucosamine 3-dehydrogenase